MSKIIDLFIYLIIVIAVSMFYFLIVDPAHAADAEISWQQYNDTNNGSYVPSRYEIVIECKTNDGEYEEVKRVSANLISAVLVNVGQTGDKLTCRARGYLIPTKEFSAYSPEVILTFPFVKPATVSGLKLSPR